MQTTFHTDNENAVDEAQKRASPPIDVEHLGRYTLGDKALEKEILGLFLTQMPDLLASLRKAQSEREWKMAAHSLKGAARAIGAWQMASAAEEAERIDFGPGRQDACASATQRVEEAGTAVRLFAEHCHSETSL
jgi:HPt (histidine-containing phosphotransfer) domain-containing protein